MPRQYTILSDVSEACTREPFDRRSRGPSPGPAARALPESRVAPEGLAKSDPRDRIFRAIHWAVNGNAKVISMALGFDSPGLVDSMASGAMPSQPIRSAGFSPRLVASPGHT